MCSEDMIKWLRKLTGVGSIHKYSRKKWSNANSIWYWQAGLQKSAQILKNILPYLKLKQKQAQLLIELANIKIQSKAYHKYKPERQREITEEFRALNKRGRY
jgi:hypothetical protein